MFIVSIDLDHTLINVNPIFEKAFSNLNCKFIKPKFYDFKICYEEEICRELEKLFKSNMIYEMNLIDDRVIYPLNELSKHPNFDVYYVTQRMVNNQNKTYEQLKRLGIECKKDNVIDHSIPKVRILNHLKTDKHFDDNPYIILDCMSSKLNCHMISNKNTIYNYHLRKYVNHSKTLYEALEKENLIVKSR